MRHLFMVVFEGDHFGLIAAESATRRLTPYDGFGTHVFESFQDVRQCGVRSMWWRR